MMIPNCTCGKDNMYATYTVQDGVEQLAVLSIWPVPSPELTKTDLGLAILLNN